MSDPAKRPTLAQVLGEKHPATSSLIGKGQSVATPPTSSAIVQKAQELERVLDAGQEVPWQDLHNLVLMIALRRLATSKDKKEIERAERALAIIYNRAPNPTSMRRGSRAPLTTRGPQKNPMRNKIKPEEPTTGIEVEAHDFEHPDD